jgi:hypothetical protein
MNRREATRLDRSLAKSDEEFLPSGNTYLDILCNVQLFAGELIKDGEVWQERDWVLSGYRLLELLDPAKEELEEYRE